MRRPPAALTRRCGGPLRGTIHRWLDLPRPDEVAVERPHPPVPLEPGQPFRVVVWNLQFCAGRRLKFFYDGGDAVHADPADLVTTLGGVTLALAQLDADVTLLQEVDRGSDRTRRLDQLRAWDALGYAATASAPYHRVRFVPFPSHRFLGRINLQLVVQSRFGLTDARRVPLPMLAEPRARRLFNLRRAVLEVRIPLTDGRHLRVLDTHLSAFSYGDGTLERQIAVVRARLAAANDAGEPWILAGDFNALPPGDDARRLGADAREYPESRSPLEPLFADCGPVVPAASLRAERFATYQPWNGAPDRCLDYVFTSSGVRVTRYEVARAHGAWSDHLPLVLEAVVP